MEIKIITESIKNAPIAEFVPMPRKCIFCAGDSRSRLSKEHIWPQWASNQLPRTIGHGIVAGKLDVKDKTTTLHKNYKRQGSVSNFTVKNVCAACNGGWMGSYEERFRIFGEAMIKGEKAHLNEEQYKTLIEYITYKIMVIDVGFGIDSIIPTEITQNFYSDRKIPDDFDVYILNCTKGNWRLGIRCVGGQLGYEIADPKAAPNVKTYAIGIGNLFIFAIFRAGGVFSVKFEPGKAHRIWPSDHNNLLWPPPLSIDSQEAEGIATFMMQSVDPSLVFDFGKA